MPIGSDGGKNGLLFEMEAGAEISHDAIIVSAVGEADHQRSNGA
jgi:hypothetical protein